MERKKEIQCKERKKFDGKKGRNSMERKEEIRWKEGEKFDVKK